MIKEAYTPNQIGNIKNSVIRSTKSHWKKDVKITSKLLINDKNNNWLRFTNIPLPKIINFNLIEYPSWDHHNEYLMIFPIIRSIST